MFLSFHLIAEVTVVPVTRLPLIYLVLLELAFLLFLIKEFVEEQLAGRRFSLCLNTTNTKDASPESQVRLAPFCSRIPHHSQYRQVPVRHYNLLSSAGQLHFRRCLRTQQAA
jgi:hypothetical protein